MIFSLFEQEILSYVPPLVERQAKKRSTTPTRTSGVSGDFQAKVRYFRRQLDASGRGQGPRLKLQLRRSRLLADAFQCVMNASSKDLQRCRLTVLWSGEKALDQGGPSSEFFCQLSRILFDPRYGLYEVIDSAQECTVHVSPLSIFVEDYDAWFRFSGRILGLALLHQHLLDVRLTRSLYKMLLRQPQELADLAALDPQFCASLRWLCENNIDDGDLTLTFTVTECLLDSTVTERELKSNGRQLRVMEANKWEYLQLMLQWRLERGVVRQLASLVRGFNEVLNASVLETAAFDAAELAHLLEGAAATNATALFNLADWRRYTEYRGGYDDQHQVIGWFWQAVARFNDVQRQQLLQFTTGSSCVPQEGFRALARGRFCIERWESGASEALPRSHTCFNRLVLPPYNTPTTLYAKLLLAVEETNTFGIS